MTEKETANPASPVDWYERWGKELAAADKEVRPWHEEGAEIEKRFTVEEQGRALNLFTINILTQHALLYGVTLPKVAVERRFADPADDVGRVAGVLLERSLNADIEKTGDTYAQALGLALLNHLVQGMGQIRERYVVEWGEEVPAKPAVMGPDGVTEIAPAVPAYKPKVYECVHSDYVHWKDFRWSPARVWSEVRWVAFGNDMSREQLAQRFGQEKADTVPLTPADPETKSEDVPKDPLARARVWEIWDRTSRKVYWYAHGAGACLEIQDDPLQLDRFFPCPEPLFSQVLGTAKLLPTPDFRVSKHLYDEVDRLTRRIADLIEDVKVRGVYDAANKQLQRLLDEGTQKMVPADNWAALSEKGGLQRSVDWLPIQPIVETISALQLQRAQAKQDLYEVTGLSDIMRGQGQGPGVTLGEQELKARFGSVRMQKTQAAFARFATDIQRIKAEIMGRLFDTESILQQANAEHMEEEKQEGLLQSAAELVKSKMAVYRIEVKPEAVSMQDFAQLRTERSELLAGLVQFLQAMAPLAQQIPGSLPQLLKVLQWFVSGLRGSKQIETVLDDAIRQAEALAQQQAQSPQGQQPDPKLAATMAKVQGDLAKVQEESKARVMEINAEVQADEQREANQMRYNVQEHLMKQQITNAMKPPTTSGGPGRMP